MAYNTKINLTKDRVYQKTGQELILSGDTIIKSVGDIRYDSDVPITGSTQLATKKYVDDNITSGGTYNLSSPATTEVGGVTVGTVLTNKSSNEILEEILTPYQTPTFSSFSNNVSNIVEMGTVLSGSKSFSWGFGNSSNVGANTMCIFDVTNGTSIATNISITSPQAATITTKTFDGSCGETQRWKGCAQDSCSTAFGSSNHTITGLYPYFWGKCTCPGAAGVGRPTLSASDITAGTKVLAGSAGSFGINFNSTDNDYLWFAVPSTVSNKVCWHVDALNNGDIGGGISAGCNLFPDNVIVNNVQNTCWNGVSYEVYMSNKQTAQTSSMAIS